MVFNIYGDNRYAPLFDIEVYSKYNEYDGKRYQHIDTSVCPKGYSEFLLKNYDDFKNQQMLNLFLNDVEELLKLNFYLQEYWRREKDYPNSALDASYYVDAKVKKEIEKFCEKWNLNINED